ncbi:hypothetical protein [Mycobacterium sp.]|uniref:hypothetical protein n=1 Tax=Mycobacterium sp. TaxID=1785 RepID=UPI003A89E06B
MEKNKIKDDKKVIINEIDFLLDLSSEEEEQVLIGLLRDTINLFNEIKDIII